MAQRYVLDKISDLGLKVYVVWGPFKERETIEDARFAAPFVPDPRATHFWTEAVAAGEVFREPLQRLGLGPHSAWDSFLVFAPNATWEERPPEPAHFMHRELEHQRLNGSRLREQIEALLAVRAAHPTANRGSPAKD